MSRLAVTEKIIATKVVRGLKWADVAERVGQRKEWVTAACLGQMTLDADQANAAYTRCLFASSREASAAQLSVSAFEARLETACDAEQAELERAAARIFASRGEANALSLSAATGDSALRPVVSGRPAAVGLVDRAVGPYRAAYIGRNR